MTCAMAMVPRSFCMRIVRFSCAFFFCLALNLPAENQTVQSSITMEQLMRELQIKGGNWVFHFDRPVFAKVVCMVSAFPEGKTSEVTEFISDRPEREVSLFFMAAPAPVGDYPMPDKVVRREMKVKLSNCAATDGTRIVSYMDKFSCNPWLQQKGQRGEYSPCLALNPELNKEYILHYYYREGDSYEAKATICFIEKPSDASGIEKFDRKNARKWKSADEAK